MKAHKDKRLLLLFGMLLIIVVTTVVTLEISNYNHKLAVQKQHEIEAAQAKDQQQKQTQLCQASTVKQQANSCLFIGCNGFF